MGEGGGLGPVGRSRRGVGMDRRPLPRLSGVPRTPLPGVLRGVLRRRPQGSAGELVGHRRARGTAHVPQLGQAAAEADLLRGPDRERRMTPPEAITIHSVLADGAERRLADDVLDGLTPPFKELPPKHFYDARGSERFERICKLPEYYPTRTELAILEAPAGESAAATGAQELVELAS